MSQTYVELSRKNEKINNEEIMENFFTACRKGSQQELAQALDNLRKNGMSINVRKNNAPAEPNGLMLACIAGNLNAVKFLIKQEGIELAEVIVQPFIDVAINALDIACQHGHKEIVKELLHASSWESLKFGRNKNNEATTIVIKAEIFLRSVTKEVNKDPKGTKSYKKDKYIKAAQEEITFVKMRAKKIYSELKADKKSTLEEKQKAFISLVKNIGLTENDLIENKSTIAQNPNALTSNFGSDFNNNNEVLQTNIPSSKN